MNRVLSYSGLVTKVKSMHSRLLTREQFQQLAGLSSISEVAAYLKQQPGYRETLAQLNEANLHRGEIELYLNQSIYRDYVKLYRFSNLKQRKFLKLYILRYETAFLKQCLRTVFEGNPISITDADGKWFFERYATFDVMRMNAASGVGELLESLRGSAYYDTLMRVHNSSRSLTLFDYEMTLDLFYFGIIWKSVQKLFTRQDRAVLLQTYGTKIDLLNLQWIYRSKKYYNMSPADIYSIIIPIHYKLKRDVISAMAEAEDAEAMTALILTTCYGRQFKEESGAALEHIYRSVLDAAHRASLRKSPYSIACINSYLYDKEHEIYRITTAIEGIRYGLRQEELIQYIF